MEQFSLQIIQIGQAFLVSHGIASSSYIPERALKKFSDIWANTLDMVLGQCKGEIMGQK